MNNCFKTDNRRSLMGVLAIVSLFFLPNIVLAGFNSTYTLTGVSNCSLAWGDYDNDGDLDLAVVGGSDSGGITRIYTNQNGEFSTDTGDYIELTGVSNCSLAWGDYDNDGDMDLAVAGNDGSKGITRIYTNQNGDFSTDAGDYIELTGVSNCSLAWGDYDNDGDLDLAVAGNDGSKGITRIYTNQNGDFSTDADHYIELTGVSNCSLAWGDYDNDGDMDLAVAGNDGSKGITRIYTNRNEGFLRDNFFLTGVSDCSLAWGDFDNDGDLDLAVAGDDGSGYITRIYYNRSGSFSAATSRYEPLSGVANCSLAWSAFRYEGEIKFALALAGDNGSDEITRIYADPIESSHFEYSLTGVSNCSLAWGDFDNDGDLDLAVAGEDGSTKLTTIYENSNIVTDFEPNTPPEAPTGLYAAASILNHTVELSWNASSDDQTPAEVLTYNIYVGTDSKELTVVSPMAGLSSGVRRIPAMGNTGQNHFAVLTDFDQDQDYYWRVQAVDSAFAGSEWSVQGTFGAIQTLAVESFGGGSGTVTSDPAGIDCGQTCSAPFARDSTVTLTATADTGSRLEGWTGGGCTGTGACTVTMDQDQLVIANFETVPIYSLNVFFFGDGFGTVVSDPQGIDCGSDCSIEFNENTPVTLTATADTGSKFEGWSGGSCSGTEPCTITMDQDRAVTAVFEPAFPRTLTMVKDGEGSGTVTSAPAGIDCGSTCQARFSLNTAVILTATPGSGSALSGWTSDHCQGNGDCLVPLTEDTLVMANFTTDSDGDGISDVVENAGPNYGDGNSDEIMDMFQNRVATFPDINGSYVTLVTEAGVLKDVLATNFPNTTVFPENFVFPLGFFGFTITGLEDGGTAQVTLLFHDMDETQAPTTYYRYGPTSEDTTDHWYEFLPGDTDTDGVDTMKDSTTTITSTLHDGKIGDDDRSLNGSIVVGAGGPAKKKPSDPGTNGGGCFLSVWF